MLVVLGHTPLDPRPLVPVVFLCPSHLPIRLHSFLPSIACLVACLLTRWPCRCPFFSPAFSYI
jgi:hypothetical protein